MLGQSSSIVESSRWTRHVHVYMGVRRVRGGGLDMWTIVTGAMRGSHRYVACPVIVQKVNLSGFFSYFFYLFGP